MIRSAHIALLVALLTFAGILPFSDTQSQTVDTTRIINFPLPHEDFSLYDFAEVRFETDKTEVPPVDIIKRNFQPVKEIFQKDSLYFADSIGTVWFKFNIHNNLATATPVALRFPIGVNKAVLYKSEGEKLIFIGKTGFTLAVIARTISYEDARIDMVLKAHSQTNYFIQIPRVGFSIIHMLHKTPALESIAYAEMKAFNREKEVNRLVLLWSHFFMGVFFMFFVFGFIKYLMLGKDRAYLYYALLGLSNALLSVSHGEYPPLELPWFENLRGVELFDLVNAIAIAMQGLFVLEILQLKIKFPRITSAVKWFLFLQLFIGILFTTAWIINKQYRYIFLVTINPIFRLLLFLLMLIWVWYLATIRKGFYRFIFLGAVTISTAFAVSFVIRSFNLYYLLPAWLGAGDQRGGLNHFIQIALVIDMCFYFAGLAYRDRQVEKDKIIFQEQLIQQLETNKELQEKFTGELQQQVKEKTAELIKQREAFEAEREAKLLADFNRKFSESELKALRSQMNPHFVFNILNTIEAYALDNNKEAASEMIQKFSRLTRLVLENSMNQLVPFENDLKALQLYVELEQMRYADKFMVVYNIQEQITEGDYLIPPMIIQPFVENAILHGLRNKPDGNGILNLSASLQNGYIVVRVEDNGIGRVKAAALKANNPIQKKSLGLKVTQDRISIFNNLSQNRKANVEIQDLDEGTRVMIWLPATG
jgi:sensor histidine kinase YesM